MSRLPNRQQSTGMPTARKPFISAPLFSYMNEPMTPQIAPTYMTPGRPRLRLPDFWVSVSPVLPSMSGTPCATALGKKAIKSNIFRRLLCRMSTEVELIGNKELAADNKEQDYTREDVAEGLV